MKLNEFTKVTTDKLNESLAKKFGQQIDLSKFTLEQMQDVRNKLRTTLSQIETNESFDKVHSEDYQKNKMFLDVLNKAIDEHFETNVTESVMTEGEEDKAEIVMAAKDMVDRITGWMEDTAEMQTESMLDLADAIRDEMGSEASELFVNTVKPALEAIYTAMETSRGSLTQGVGQLTGEAEPTDTMGAEDPTMAADPAMEPTVDGDMAADAEVPVDDTEVAEPAAGGEEEAGREKRESVERPKKKSLKA